MRNTLRSFAVAVTVLFVGSLLLAPAGSAQTLTIDGPPSVDGIRPGLGGVDFNLDFNYIFDNAAATVGQLEKGFVQVGVTTSCTNNQFLITGPGAVLITLEQAPTITSTAKAGYSVSATRNAPGLQEVRCTVTGTGEALNTAVVNPATNTYTHAFNALADFYGAMSVSLSTPIQKAGPQKELPFNLEFNNFGNANTRVKFAIANDADRPSGDRWRHVLPTDLIIGSAALGGDNTGAATFQVSTPYKTGWNNVVGNYLLTMNTEALDDSTQKGNTMTASILVRVRGVYVPGFEVVALVGGLLGAVVMTRRREE